MLGDIPSSLTLSVKKKGVGKGGFTCLIDKIRYV